LRAPPHESKVQPQRRMLGNTHGPGAAAGRTKRMPDERADGGGPGGKRRKKERAESTVPASTKDADRVLSPSVPKKRIRKLCEHKRQRSKCKDCGGSSICEHQRQRSKCKDCGGGSFCEHQRRRSQCKECGGGSFCEHQRRRSRCKDCREAKNKAAEGNQQKEREEEQEGGRGGGPAGDESQERVGGKEEKGGQKRAKRAKTSAPEMAPLDTAPEMAAAATEGARAPEAQRARGDQDGQAHGRVAVADKGIVVAQQDARARGKRARTPLDEALPSLPASPANHRKMNESARGGARGEGGSAAAVGADTAGREVAGMDGGAAEGKRVGANAVKEEEYDGSYACSICWNSVRGDAAVLRCLQCSSNPFHRACYEKTNSHKCPQCSGKKIVPWVASEASASNSTSATPLTIDLTGDP